MTIPYAGKRTYVVGGLLVLFGIVGFITGKLDGATALTTILEGLGFIGIRLAIK